MTMPGHTHSFLSERKPTGPSSTMNRAKSMDGNVVTATDANMRPHDWNWSKATVMSDVGPSRTHPHLSGHHCPLAVGTQFPACCACWGTDVFVFIQTVSWGSWAWFTFSGLKRATPTTVEDHQPSKPSSSIASRMPPPCCAVTGIGQWRGAHLRCHQTEPLGGWVQWWTAPGLDRWTEICNRHCFHSSCTPAGNPRPAGRRHKARPHQLACHLDWILPVQATTETLVEGKWSWGLFIVKIRTSYQLAM